MAEGREVRDQVSGVELRLAVVLVVDDAASLVRRHRVHQTQRQHVVALSLVRPHGVAAARARRVIVPRLQLLAVGAGAAQPPRLDPGNTGVDAGDAHVPAAGVKLVLRRKLAQRRRRGAFVLVDLLIVAALLRRTAFAAPPDHRPQRDPLLRERVVGNESLVGEELVRVAAVQAAQDALQSLALARELLDLGVPRFVGRVALERADAPAKRLDLGADRLALVGHLKQAVQDPNRERRPLAGVALQELRQVVAGNGGQVVREGGQEAFQQSVRVALHEVEEGIGEAAQSGGFHVVEHRADGPRHRSLGHSVRHPVCRGRRR